MDIEKIIRLLKSDVPEDIILGYEYAKIEFGNNFNKILADNRMCLTSTTVLWGIGDLDAPADQMFKHAFRIKDNSLAW